MKNRINTLLEKKPSGLVSVYFTAGHPYKDSAMPILKALQDNGADMAEIGIPFSDPMADGPVIQNSSSVALKNGMSVRTLFEQLKNVRDEITIPLLFMGYLNPIMQYGFENFCVSCKKTGIDGMIIPDLPFQDYVNYYKPVAAKYGVSVIMLITPETSSERVRLIDDNTSGFIYIVSSASTTGAKDRFGQEHYKYFERIKDMGLKNKCLIGFGISNKETLRDAQKYSSGAIIGSKFVKLLEENETPDKATKVLFSEIAAGV